MTFSRAAFALAIAGLLATGCAPSSDVDDIEDADDSFDAVTPDGNIHVQFGNPGAGVNSWGYDIKQGGRSEAMTPELAQEIFVDTGMNMLRIAVRAKEGHPARGVSEIVKNAYKHDLAAIAIVRAARPDVKIFASLKLLADETFPGWVESGGKVNADDYATLLQNYLAYMNQKNVTIDVLGIDCEQRFNKGGINPAKYNAIVSKVRSYAQANGLKVPDFVGAEDYGPSYDIPWLKNLAQTADGFKNVDHVGVHLYSKHRDAAYADSIHALAQLDHGKGLWDTEFHWNDLDENGTTFKDVKPGMLLAMDHFDAGFHSMTWWAFQPRSMGIKSAHIMSELVQTTIGAKVLPTNDMDGVNNTMNKFNSRAFKNGPKQVTLWVANYGNGQPDQKTEVGSQDVASASFVRWSSTSPIAGVKGEAKVKKKKPNTFEMDFPADTITRVTVLLK